MRAPFASLWGGRGINQSNQASLSSTGTANYSVLSLSPYFWQIKQSVILKNSLAGTGGVVSRSFYFYYVLVWVGLLLYLRLNLGLRLFLPFNLTRFQVNLLLDWFLLRGSHLVLHFWRDLAVDLRKLLDMLHLLHLLHVLHLLHLMHLLHLLHLMHLLHLLHLLDLLLLVN